MLDAYYLLSGYPLATDFVSDVIEERYAIVVYDNDGDWGGSATIRPAACDRCGLRPGCHATSRCNGGAVCRNSAVSSRRKHSAGLQENLTGAIRRQ